jgi:hypothetical protein
MVLYHDTAQGLDSVARVQTAETTSLRKTLHFRLGMRRFLHQSAPLVCHGLQNIRVTLAKVVGKICVLRKEVRLSCFSASFGLLAFLSAGYSQNVTAYQ